jgi:hypothetical protein
MKKPVQNVLKLCVGFLLGVSSYSASAQDLQVAYYGHAGYTAKFDTGSQNHSAFNSGGLDVLLTSQINDKVSAICELFSGYRGDGSNSVALSIERLNFKYIVNDYVNVRIGRMYTPLGFWQSRYSQAQFFQPTINAPYAVRTKYDKGILPTNSVGLQIDGENIGKMRFGYYLMLDNSSGAPSLNTDNTDFKAFTGKLKVQPVDNLEIFASGRYDQIAKGSTSLQGRLVGENTTETIYNAGFVHIARDAKWEYAAEYYYVTNQTNKIGMTSNQFSYAYLGYKVNKVTPYLQGDLLDFDTKDQFFDVNSLRGLLVGGRYSFSPTAILKVEYKFRTTDRLDHQDVISVQVSARF